MKIAFKSGGKNIVINFTTSVSPTNSIICVPSTIKDSDAIDTITNDTNEQVVIKGIQQYIDRVLRMPVGVILDKNYKGHGFGFKLDMYDLIKGL
jgi:hypothetical protein